MKRFSLAVISFLLTLSVSPLSAVYGTEAQQAFNYLNQIRKQAGMIPFTYNSSLQEAAQNHSYYLHTNRVGGHGERSGRRGYTGRSHVDRIVRTGYLSRQTGENVSYHSHPTSAQKSVDGLMSAIYHRLAFLSFEYDEAGAGASVSPEYSAYTYNFGSTAKVEMCNGAPFTRPGPYTYSVCPDTRFRVAPDAVQKADSIIQNKNPDHVIWPAKNAIGIPPGFYEEDPDPVPYYDVTGYPVSIQFNPATYFLARPVITRFEIFRQRDNRKEEETMFLSTSNDRNEKIQWNEFVLFPLQRLDWNTVYRVELVYEIAGLPKQMSWKFRTQSLPMPTYIWSGKHTPIKLEAGKKIAVYVPPSGPRDGEGSYRSSYSEGLNLDIDIYDYHTLIIKASGQPGHASIDFHGRKILLNF